MAQVFDQDWNELEYLYDTPKGRCLVLSGIEKRWGRLEGAGYVTLERWAPKSWPNRFRQDALITEAGRKAVEARRARVS